MTKDNMIAKLEKFVRTHGFGNDPTRYGIQSTALVSAMNLLADLKGYKVQYCRKIC